MSWEIAGCDSTHRIKTVSRRVSTSYSGLLFFRPHTRAALDACTWSRVIIVIVSSGAFKRLNHVPFAHVNRNHLNSLRRHSSILFSKYELPRCRWYQTLRVNLIFPDNNGLKRNYPWRRNLVAVYTIDLRRGTDGFRNHISSFSFCVSESGAQSRQSFVRCTCNRVLDEEREGKKWRLILTLHLSRIITKCEIVRFLLSTLLSMWRACVRACRACVHIANNCVTMRACERHCIISVLTSSNFVINPLLCIIAAEQCVTSRRQLQ